MKNKLFCLFLLFLTQISQGSEQAKEMAKELTLVHKTIGLNFEDFLKINYLPILIKNLAHLEQSTFSTYEKLITRPKSGIISFLIIEKPVLSRTHRINQIYKIILNIVFDKNNQFSLEEKLELLNMTIKALGNPQDISLITDFIKQDLTQELPHLISNMTLQDFPANMQIVLQQIPLNQFKEHILKIILSKNIYLNIVSKKLFNQLTNIFEYLSLILDQYLHNPKFETSDPKTIQDFVRYLKKHYRYLDVLMWYLNELPEYKDLEQKNE